MVLTGDSGPPLNPMTTPALVISLCKWRSASVGGGAELLWRRTVDALVASHPTLSTSSVSHTSVCYLGPLSLVFGPLNTSPSHYSDHRPCVDSDPFHPRTAQQPPVQEAHPLPLGFPWTLENETLQPPELSWEVQAINMLGVSREMEPVNQFSFSPLKDYAENQFLLQLLRGRPHKTEQPVRSQATASSITHSGTGLSFSLAARPFPSLLLQGGHPH